MCTHSKVQVAVLVVSERGPGCWRVHTSPVGCLACCGMGRASAMTHQQAMAVGGVLACATRSQNLTTGNALVALSFCAANLGKAYTLCVLWGASRDAWNSGWLSTRDLYCCSTHARMDTCTDPQSTTWRHRCMKGRSGGQLNRRGANSMPDAEGQTMCFCQELELHSGRNRCH